MEDKMAGHEILKLWLDWVNKHQPDTDSGFVGSYCFFCGAIGYPPKHEDDCVFRLTEDYLHTTAEESAR